MLEGGCLCRATRYQATDYDRVAHCHCAICKKATGAAFATWVCIKLSLFRQLSGEATFRRSFPKCSRGFCPECGTPLFMKYDGDDEIAVSLGSLDHPERVSPDYSILDVRKTDLGQLHGRQPSAVPDRSGLEDPRSSMKA